MFPILDDDMLSDYQSDSLPEEKSEMEQLFGIQEVVQPSDTNIQIPKSGKRREIVSVTLFWKNLGKYEPSIPSPSRERFLDGTRLGLVKRFPPHQEYFQPMIRFIDEAKEKFPEVTFRVYLASDLDFLIPELTESGWEVCLMKSPSIRYCPGGFWRFLALEEEDALVTIIDADRMEIVESEITRTRVMDEMNLGLWRVPGYYNSDLRNFVRYRPILGGHFGAKGGIPVRKLIEAFVWHSRHDTIDKSAHIPGLGEKPVLFTDWPGYGFDEWFQLAALYPRLAQNGTLTYIPHDSRSTLLPVDLEYAMWANPRSESIYF